MPRPTQVEARPNYRLWLRFDDGIEGELDVSDLAGRGVFKAWNDVTFFETARIATHGSVVWGDELELCPDALYLRLTGKSAESVFPRLSEAEVDA